MARSEFPEERLLRAHLTSHPHDAAACGGCMFYAPRTDGEGYCAHADVQLNVLASWWCRYYARDESRVKLAGHPLHPALIPFPLALTGLALVFDVVSLMSRRSLWRREATHALVAASVGGVLAAPAGLFDWLALPVDGPAKRYGLVHGLGNLTLLALNGLNVAIRNRNAEPSRRSGWGETGLSAAAVSLSLATGWLGRQLTYRFGVGVEPPVAEYYAVEVKPEVRLSRSLEWTDGRVQIPSEPVWSGPAVPSQPIPEPAQHRMAAS